MPDVPLPEGFTLEPPTGRPGIRVPEGFTVAPPREPGLLEKAYGGAKIAAGLIGKGIENLPNLPGAIANIDPIEAMKAVERGAIAAPGAIANVAKDIGSHYADIAKRAVETGDISPKEALDVAQLASPASITGRGGYLAAERLAQAKKINEAQGTAFPTVGEQLGGIVTRNIRDPVAAAAERQLGIDVPKAAEMGTVGQAVARGLTAIPLGGGELRKTADEATKQLLEAGGSAAAMPTGVVPSQNLAGSNVRRQLNDIIANAAASGTSVQPGLRRMLGQSNEDMIGSIMRMASDTKPGANRNALAQLRAGFPTQGWQNVQGALIDRMGQGPTGEFDPNTWLRNYGSIPVSSRNILFRDQALRTHLDSLEEVSRRAPDWQQFSAKRSVLGSKFGVGALLSATVGAAYAAPLTTLTTLVGAHLMGKFLSQSVTAAPIAQWSRAYEKLVTSGGAPQALAGLTIATRNLNNSLGTNVSVQDALKGSQDGQSVE